MPAKNARPFMSSPSASPTGSSLFRRIPVDLRRSWPSTCPAIFPGVRPDALSPYSFRSEKSNGFCHPASIPTYLSFLGCHNWSQISGVPDGQMALYGIAAVLLAEREPNLRAVVVFSGAGYSFDRSPELRARLLAAIDHVAAPVFFIHAENDYSLSSGKVLDARREHIGKPHRLKIYPPIGHTVDDGHDFLHLGVNIWEPDVFAFL